MLTLEQASERVLSAIPPVVPERVPLDQACGKILFAPVRSPIDLPPFDNSAMDGYAVRSEETSGASSHRPVILKLSGRIPAGSTAQPSLQPGHALRIYTGSPMPQGADAVVMQEETRNHTSASDEIQVLCPVDHGENVRHRGEDIVAGTTLAKAGDQITPARLALLSATGTSVLSVGRQPRVGLLATGSELKRPGEPLAPGQIYECSCVALAGLVGAAGGVAHVLDSVRDDLEATRAALEAAFSRFDVVVTCGGASVGDLDFLKPAFAQLGGELDFWKVSIRPGRPFVFGRIRDRLLFGLPGNPVSALVTFQLLVRPALLRWQGATDLQPSVRSGALAAALSNSSDRRHFTRVRFDESGKVTSAGLQASHALGALAASDGLVDVSPGAVLAAGTTVQVMLWR